VFFGVSEGLKTIGISQAVNQEAKGGEARDRTATAESEFQVRFETNRTNKVCKFHNGAEDGLILY
jgi:hypothetical protein